MSIPLRLSFIFSAIVLVFTSAIVVVAADSSTFKPDIELGQQTSFKFVVYGDTRFTNPADKGASSAQDRDEIVKKIADVKPDFVVMTGDIVYHGDNSDDWSRFDAETAAWREASIRLLPVLGNHDLAGKQTTALHNYFRRFPDLHDRRWYSARTGNSVFFMLDSSQDQPGGEESQWLESQLQQLPPDIHFVFAVLHHPPITKSSDMHLFGGHSARPHEKALATLIENAAKNSRAQFFVLAGHVHNYERYQQNGVTYIVTGGGGAHPYEVPRSPTDAYHDPGPTYHYCEFSIHDLRLTYDMQKLTWSDDGKPKWEKKDEFQIDGKNAASGKAAGY